MTEPTRSTDATAALAGLWKIAGGDASALERVTITGADPVLPTNFKIGTAASATIAATALAAAELWRQRTGRAQTVGVDMRAAVAAFRSERYLRVNGEAPHERDPLFGFYRTVDGRWVQIHSNFPHHRERLLKLLGCEATREAVAAAVSQWKGEDLEDAVAAARTVSAMVRARDEWRDHPQGRAVGALPTLEIEKIGDSAPEPVGNGDRPLGGVRVLDLTRVIAGPVCGRALASHGADVLYVTSPRLPNIPAHIMDIGLGKRSTYLDLDTTADRDTLRGLVRGADVFSQGYRPGALARHGFGPDALARIRPGIVCLSLCAYGHVGPWRERRGFETLIQTVSGMAHEHGASVGAEGPRHLPAQVVDHGTGYLAAFGTLMALGRRAREGGSYLVRVSLAQTGWWVDSLGRVDGVATPDQTLADVDDLLAERDSAFGRLRHVVPPARLSETPCAWTLPPVPTGTHPPTWAA